MNPLEEYRLTSMDINWESVDTSTYAKESFLATGRVRVTVKRGADTVTITRIGTAGDVLKKAVAGLDALR